jgi:hypothetical protein
MDSELLQKKTENVESIYIYILHEREFLNLNQDIYKIYYTTNNINIFMNEIPKGSNILLFQHISKNNNIIEIILKNLRKYFIEENKIGEKYFKGDVDSIIELINYILYNKVYNKYKNIIKNDVYWWDD